MTATITHLRSVGVEANSPDLASMGVEHPRPFICTMDVATSDMSTVVDHVSNIEYVRWLDRAAELHSDAVGYTREVLLGEDRMWFVARHEIDYCAEVRAGERLVIATWARSFDRVKSWRDYVIVRPENETVVCRAATLWVLVRLSSRRPQRIPASMIDAFDPLIDDRPE